MTLSTLRRLAPVIAVATVSALGALPVVASDQAQPRSWWKSDEFKAALGLTADQSARIDSIFQTTLPELRQDMDELDRLENRLSRLIESDAEETEIARHIDRVEMARANVNKTRSLMLVRMRRVLTPEQRVRMKTLEQEHKRDSNARRRSTPDANKSNKSNRVPGS
jgi:Spy/CpxP family protein refolding chaperone